MSISLNSSDKLLLSNRGYSIHKQIGEGSYSKVYSATYVEKAENEKFPKGVKIQLACKFINSEKMPKDFCTKFLSRELHVISNISHPHIIHIHSILQRGPKYMIFMRKAELGNLCDFIITYGAVREKVARTWIRQIILALIYMHTLDIAHRDIKCENILLTENNNVKLADFGFARFSIDIKGKPIFCSTYCGSFPYAAPELLRGVPYNPKLSDIWAVGIVLYIMLNKIMPFKQLNVTDMYESQINRNYKFKPHVLMTVSPEVVSIVSLMLEPNCLDRIPLEDIMKSKWMLSDPKLRDLSDLESEAMAHAIENKDEIRPYKHSKIDVSEGPMKIIIAERNANVSDKLLPTIIVNKNES